MKQVNFYFDFVSPYPWLASHQLDELVRMRLDLNAHELIHGDPLPAIQF
jgi:2-hydroxychromene-2-carboxylate isomerase